MGAQATSGATAAGPDRVEALLHFVEQALVVGDDAGLEVAAAIAFGAEPRAGEVGRAQVEQPAVDRDHLEVGARALPQRDELALGVGESLARGLEAA